MTLINDSSTVNYPNIPNVPPQTPSLALRLNDIIQFNSSNLSFYNDESNNLDAQYINSFFPPSILIERIFNDYIENKNKLTNDEYNNNTEQINEKLEECPICFCESEYKIKLKNCEHMFCEDCIRNWLQNHKNSCPICITKVKELNSNNTNSNDSNQSNESSIIPLNYTGPTGPTNNIQEIDTENEIGGEFSINNND